MTNNKEELVNAKQLAEILNVTRTTIYRWKKQGLPCIEFSTGTSRFRMSEVLAWQAGIDENFEDKEG